MTHRGPVKRSAPVVPPTVARVAPNAKPGDRITAHGHTFRVLPRM